MNNQEAFETVVRHLYKQNERAIEDIDCLYAAPDGTKCAVGCLLPSDIGEELDYAEIGGWRDVVRSPNSAARTARELLSGVSEQLLQSLQVAHDEADEPFWTNIAPVLKNLGNVYSLVWPEDVP